MIYTLQVALVCAGSMSAVAVAVLLLYRKRISKPDELPPSVARILGEK